MYMRFLYACWACIPYGTQAKWVFFGVSVVVLFIILGVGLCKERRSRHLVRWGTPTRGIVTHVTEGVGGEGGSTYWITVAYDTPERLYLTLPFTHVAYRVGDPMTVLYALESPSKAATYQACHYRAVRVGGSE